MYIETSNLCRTLKKHVNYNIDIEKKRLWNIYIKEFTFEMFEK